MIVLPSGPPSNAAQQERAVIQRENAVFLDAYQKGRIDKATYEQQIAFQNKRLTDNVVPPETKITHWTTEYESSKSFYEGIGYPQYGGSYSAPAVPEGMTVTNVTQKEDQLLFTLAPKNVSGESEALAQAKQISLWQENYQARSSSRQGTSPPSNAFLVSPTVNLSAADKQAFVDWQEKRVRENTASLGTFLIAGAIAPVLGPVSVAKAVVLGVGISQGIKTGVTAYQGGDVSASLLTPNEALQAAETGVIFAGLGGYASGALGLGGKSASIVVNVAKAGGRIGLSTTIGAGAGTVAEYVDSGKVTGQGALQGAEFGLAFGLASESVGLVRQGGRAIYNKVGNAIRPQQAIETSLYNRAIASDGSTAPIGSKGWVETLKLKLTPKSFVEHSLYQKATMGNGPVGEGDLVGAFDANTQADVFKVTTFDRKAGGFAKDTMVTKEFQVESQGGSRQWTKQQLYQKPAQVQKTSLNKTFAVMDLTAKTQPKSFLLTGIASLGAVSKVKVSSVKPVSIIAVKDKAGIQDTDMSVGRQQTEFASMGQAANPFLKSKTKPYYSTGQSSDVDEETYLASYLNQSPLSQPKEVAKSTLLQGSFAKEISKATAGFKLDWGIGQTQGQPQIQRQGQPQIQDSGSMLVHETKTEELIKLQSKQGLKMNLSFGMGDFNIGGFSKGSPRIKRGHKQQTRVYPIVTGAQMIKALLSKQRKTKSKGHKKK